MGWLMLYAGVTKLLDPQWSATFYLKGAKTFPAFYQWFLQPDVLPITNLLNAWGLTLVGIALILGIAMRLSVWGGIALMALYYFPILDFPLAGEHSYIVDEHVIYAAALLVLGVFGAGRAWGFGGLVVAQFPRLRVLLG